MKKIILFIFATLFFTSAHAQNDEIMPPIDVSTLPVEIQNLVSSSSRPTMLEVRDAIAKYKFPKGIPINVNWANHYGYDQRTEIEKWTEILLDYAPELIARLEKVYPDAVWVFIGRDGAAFADVLEAFYYSIGQKNRVIRFGVSKQSMRNISYEAVQQGLKRQGYDLDQFADKYDDRESITIEGFRKKFLFKRKEKKAIEAYPKLIFVDPVSKGNGRQGRHILGLIYENLFQRTKVDWLELIQKINIMGLVVSTHPGGHFSANDPEAYYAHYRDNISRNDPSLSGVYQAHQFMSIDQAANAANEAGYTHFIGAWHDSYGSFYQNNEGELEAQRGSDFHVEMKMSILWSQAKIWKTVSKPKFLEKVKKFAQDLGYEFEAERSGGCEDILRAS